jgi:DNA-binding SARP family transcriptional activator
MIEFRVLGPLEVERDGTVVALRGRRQRSVLAILLLHAGSVVSLERLADDLYAGETPSSAVTQVHRQISALRRLLPAARLETTPPGYVLRLEPQQLDLKRFERLAEEGVERLEQGDAARARALLGDALGLWRGPALADLDDQPFAHSAIARLEELRVTVLERRLAADLALGRGSQVAPELEELVAMHPLRERFTELLMLALYDSGRQADALAAYRTRRAALADELGLEPGPALRRLEAGILRQDPVLMPHSEPGLAAERRLVVAAAVRQPPSPTLIALAAMDGHDAILLELVEDEAALTAAAEMIDGYRAVLGPGGRTAAFVATDWPGDLATFTRGHDAALVLVEAQPGAEQPLPAKLLRHATADVAVVVRGHAGLEPGDVYVPFGGGDHDWAALELGAAIARSRERTLRLVGTRSASGAGRDASPMLAEASLAVQRAFGISSMPVLTPPTPEALVATVQDGALVVAGVGSRWQAEGLGATRSALLSSARPPVLLVHRGPHPGLLAPRETSTRYSWSLQN